VFGRSGTEWAQVTKLTGAGENAFFGARLALAGGRALIGAYGENNATGAVYPFTFANGTWQAGEKLVADQPQPQTGFGYAIDLTAEHALVSAPRAAGGAGVIYAFRAAGDGWAPAGTIAAPDSANEMFGAMLARAGTDLLIGASAADDRRGAIYTLREANGSWTVAGRVSSPVAQRGQFGSAVAAGAEVVVAAIPGADFGLGRVAVLERQGDELRVVAQLEGEGPASLPALTGDERRCGDADSVAVFGCRDVDLLAFLPVRDIGGSRGVQLNDVWGWTDPESNREYAIVGRMDGTSFIDVTDPVNPVYLGDLPLTEGANPNVWRDMKVYRNHVFIVADAAGEHGMQVFDLARLRSVPAGTPAKFAADVTYDRINSAHNIVINEESGFAYIVGSSGGESCGGGLHMVDIREPQRPTFAGCFADPQTGRASTGYTHDAQCVMYRGPDADYQGREICLGANETALSIADVTDKANPKALSRASYPNVGYSHQGWLTDDHRYFFMDDELDELNGSVTRTRTVIWDVSDLDDPQVAAEFLGTTAASDHNLYIRGDTMYQSNYQAGLRVVDISEVTAPVEVGYFDTVPTGTNTPGFGGSWSNYPYFRSGTIVVTSGSEGVFLLKKRPAPPVS
jgi:choice-of-anchor B domain-containing protein